MESEVQLSIPLPSPTTEIVVTCENREYIQKRANLLADKVDLDRFVDRNVTQDAERVTRVQRTNQRLATARAILASCLTCQDSLATDTATPPSCPLAELDVERLTRQIT